VGGLDDLVSPGLGELAGDSAADLESAAVTTGLKWALETGPNIKMSTANPKTVAVEFSKSASRHRQATVALRRFPNRQRR